MRIGIIGLDWMNKFGLCNLRAYLDLYCTYVRAMLALCGIILKTY